MIKMLKLSFLLMFCNFYFSILTQEDLARMALGENLARDSFFERNFFNLTAQNFLLTFAGCTGQLSDEAQFFGIVEKLFQLQVSKQMITDNKNIVFYVPQSALGKFVFNGKFIFNVFKFDKNLEKLQICGFYYNGQINTKFIRSSIIFTMESKIYIPRNLATQLEENVMQRYCRILSLDVRFAKFMENNFSINLKRFYFGENTFLLELIKSPFNDSKQFCNVIGRLLDAIELAKKMVFENGGNISLAVLKDFLGAFSFQGELIFCVFKINGRLLKEQIEEFYNKKGKIEYDTFFVRITCCSISKCLISKGTSCVFFKRSNENFVQTEEDYWDSRYLLLQSVQQSQTQMMHPESSNLSDFKRFDVKNVKVRVFNTHPNLENKESVSIYGLKNEEQEPDCVAVDPKHQKSDKKRRKSHKKHRKNEEQEPDCVAVDPNHQKSDEKKSEPSMTDLD